MIYVVYDLINKIESSLFIHCFRYIYKDLNEFKKTLILGIRKLNKIVM